MSNRRKFIKGGILGAIGTAIFPRIISAKKGRQNSNSKSGFPIVISTWEHGIAANKAAMKILVDGGRAIDAVESGVRVSEADPEIMSVGFGGLPDREGKVTLDACIMDETGNCGAVSFLQHIKHPISVARKIMDETPHVMLSGIGALQFALEKGFIKENLLTSKAKKKWQDWLKKSEYKPIINVENHDTIGLLALDEKGNILYDKDSTDNEENKLFSNKPDLINNPKKSKEYNEIDTYKPSGSLVYDQELFDKIEKKIHFSK